MAKWIMDMVTATGYLGIVVLMFVENVFPPIPSELIMPLAGYMATQGTLAFIGVVIAGTLGSVLGALPLYYLGRKVGEERVKTFADTYGRWLTVSRKDIEQAKGWFDRHGGMAVLICRLVPGVRSLISIPADVDRMSIMSFLIYTVIGTSLRTASCILALFSGPELPTSE